MITQTSATQDQPTKRERIQVLQEEREWGDMRVAVELKIFIEQFRWWREGKAPNGRMTWAVLAYVEEQVDKLLARPVTPATVRPKKVDNNHGRDKAHLEERASRMKQAYEMIGILASRGIRYVDIETLTGFKRQFISNIVHNRATPGLAMIAELQRLVRLSADLDEADPVRSTKTPPQDMDELIARMELDRMIEVARAKEAT